MNLRNEEEINTLSDAQKLKEFSTPDMNKTQIIFHSRHISLLYLKTFNGFLWHQKIKNKSKVSERERERETQTVCSVFLRPISLGPEGRL